MPLPSVLQTFALESCRDLLQKLKWEIDQLQRAEASDPEALAFHAFNAAITAWHLADWVWHGLSDEKRNALGLKTLRDLQKMTLKCRVLHYCRQIATASKHVTVERHHDPTIETTVSATWTPAPMGTSPEPVAFTTWAVKIIDGDKRLDAATVFSNALNYWTEFIYQHKIE